MIKKLLVLLLVAGPLCGIPPKEDEKKQQERKQKLEEKKKELCMWRAAVCCVKGMRCVVKPLITWCCKGKK